MVLAQLPVVFGSFCLHTNMSVNPHLYGALQTEAMKREAAASAEALAAERAAKFAADAEAKELQRFLDDTNTALQKQQEFTQRLGSDAAKAKEDLKAALANRSELVTNNQGLTQVCCLCSDCTQIACHSFAPGSLIKCLCVWQLDPMYVCHAV